MIERLRRTWRGFRRSKQAVDPLVKVAGAYTREEALTCLEALRSREIRGEVRDQGGRRYEIWVPASQEAQARLVLGLSGRSVIRLPRWHRVREKGRR